MRRAKTDNEHYVSEMDDTVSKATVKIGDGVCCSSLPVLNSSAPPEKKEMEAYFRDVSVLRTSRTACKAKSTIENFVKK